MIRKLFSILQYIFFLGAGLFLVWWQLRTMTQSDTQSFLNALRHANYLIIFPILIMALLSHLSRSMRWKLLMEPLGYKPSLKNVFAATMVGYMANAAIPRLGEVLKCSILARYENLRVDKLVGTIIVERIFDFLCFLFLIAATILMQINVVESFIKNKIENIKIAGANHLSIIVIIGSAIIVIGILLLRRIYRKYPNNTIVISIKRFTHGFREGLASINHLKRRGAFLAHSLFIWSMYLLQIYIGFYTIQETSHLGILASFSILTLATFAMILTPGGIGSFPVFVMQTLLLYNISQPIGNAFGWLMWGVSSSIIIIVGFISLILLPVMNKKIKDETSAINPL